MESGQWRCVVRGWQGDCTDDATFRFGRHGSLFRGALDALFDVRPGKTESYSGKHGFQLRKVTDEETATELKAPMNFKITYDRKKNGVREARTLDLRITRYSYETYALANCATTPLRHKSNYSSLY